MSKKVLPSGCQLVAPRPMYGETTRTYKVLCDGSADAQMDVVTVESNHAGKGIRKGDVLVESIMVWETLQRKGVATKLYEQAAKDACKKGARLVSRDRMPGAHSNDFWEKQHRKGRVEKHGKGEDAIYVLDCAHSSDLSGLKGRKRCPPGYRKHRAKNGTVTCRRKRR